MRSERQRVFYGWWVVLAAAVGLFWGIPVSVYSFGVFLKPLIHDFHSSRAAVSLGFTLQALVHAGCAPLAGWLIGRFGTRRVVVPAAAMFGLILLSMRAFSGGIAQFYLFYVALGLVGTGVGPIPYGNVISRWFDRRRGLALGLGMLGIGAGAMIVPLLAQHFIAEFGWRTAYAIFGCAVLLVSVPAAATWLKDRPQDLGLLPDGDTRNDGMAAADAESGLRARDALRSRTFWILVCAFFLVGASVQGCLVHAVAMFSDSGLSMHTAALGGSLLGCAVLIGRLGTGYLLDRFFAPRIAAIFFACVAAGIGLFLKGGETPWAFAGAFLVGLGLGAEVDIIPYSIGRYFGLRAFAQICGVAFACFILAGAVGPLLMGAGFDLTGSYRGVLMVFVAATALAALLMTTLGPYRYRARQPNMSSEDSRSLAEERPSALEQPG
jgi:MFS family permease